MESLGGFFISTQTERSVRACVCFVCVWLGGCVCDCMSVKERERVREFGLCVCVCVKERESYFMAHESPSHIKGLF